MIRAIIQSCVEGVIKRLTSSGRPGETIADREYLQHYGYTSRPLAGAEAVIIREGGHFLAIASDDRRYRIALEAGEVAIYDHLGQKAHLKANGTMAVAAVNEVEVTAPVVRLVAATKVRMETPLLEVTGNIVAGGNVSDQGGAKSMAGMRNVYNYHSHRDNSHGVETNTPTQVM